MSYSDYCHWLSHSSAQMVRLNNFNEDNLVNREFGIQVGDGLTSVNARVLPPPMVIFCCYILFVRGLLYFESHCT